MHVRYAVEAGQVAQQHLVDDVVADILARVGLVVQVERHFGIAAIVDIVYKCLVQQFDVGGLEAVGLVAVPLYRRLAQQVFLAAQPDVLIEGQRRKAEVAEAAGAALVAALFEGCGGTARCHKADVVICVEKRLEVHLPVFQVLHLIEEYEAFVAHPATVAIGLHRKIEQSFEVYTIVYGRFDRYENNVFRVHAFVYQTLDCMENHNCFPHTAWPHQYLRPIDLVIFH